MPTDVRWDAVLGEAGKAQEQFHIPGVAIGILADGETRTGGVGVTDLRVPLAVDGDTLFQIGSISKTVTAALTLMLHQRGLLDLDAPLRTYLPGFQVADQEASERVTPRLLFSHTVGWLGDDLQDQTSSLELAVERMRWLPQLFPFGSLWSYNNAAFYPAGRLVEVLSGRQFIRMAREDLFQPLGMHDTAHRHTDLLTEKLAMGFSADYEDGKGSLPGRWDGQEALAPVVGVSSTARDMVRWAQFTIDGRDNAGNELLSVGSRRLLCERRYPVGLDQSVGFTWFARDAGGARLISHSGSMRFQQSHLLIAPERGFALVLLTNSERGFELIDRVTREALRAYLDIDTPQPEPHPGSAEALAPYAGHYTAQLADVHLDLAGDTLWLQLIPKPIGSSPNAAPPPPPTRLALMAQPDVLVALDPPLEGKTIPFLRNESGDVAWLRNDLRLHRRRRGGLESVRGAAEP